MKCGLLGRKLGHSYSPAIHSHFGDYEYRLYEKEPEELEDFLRNGEFIGINVTMPYKKAVIPFLDQLTDVAIRVGAVNTIYRQDGKLIGHNTDFYGFEQMLRSSGISPASKKCLVLGSGGASDVAAKVLQDAGGQVIIISRTGEYNYTNLHLHADASVLVNATPVGMYPNTGISPVDLNAFPRLEAALDVIYNPAKTQLLLDAEKRGLVTGNGLWMLVCQAKEASQTMTGSSISLKKTRDVYHLLRQQMENIILIGMPGCGKTTIGRILAEATGKTFVDTDAEVEALAGKSISRIFAEDGQDAFRALESRVLAHYGKQSGQVIATGGGCVTKAGNYTALRQNGTIYWLRREISLLPRDNRPLSQSQDLTRMYAEREPFYREFAEHIIENDGTPEDAAKKIMECLI